MTTTHTPGPWAIEAAPNGYTYIRAEHRAEIALVGGENMLADDSSAASNARLIAAAPDLLAALLSALSDAKPTASREYWRDGADGESSELVREETWPDWIDAARAAITRATA